MKETLNLTPLRKINSKFNCDDPETTNSELSKDNKKILNFLMPSKKSNNSYISQNTPNTTGNEGINIKIHDFSSNASSYQNLYDSAEENATPMFIQNE